MRFGCRYVSFPGDRLIGLKSTKPPTHKNIFLLRQYKYFILKIKTTCSFADINCCFQAGFWTYTVLLPLGLSVATEVSLKILTLGFVLKHDLKWLRYKEEIQIAIDIYVSEAAHSPSSTFLGLRIWQIFMEYSRSGLESRPRLRFPAGCLGCITLRGVVAVWGWLFLRSCLYLQQEFSITRQP